MKIVKLVPEVWTPQMAREALRACTGQRTPSTPRVLALRRDMLLGRWKTSAPSPLCFGRNNNLINGQHRLLALAGLPDDFEIAFYVMRDPDLISADETMVDLGLRPRNVGTLPGHDRRTIEVARLISVMASGDHKVVTPAELLQLEPAVDVYHCLLTKTKARRVTVAIRSGAVLRMSSSGADASFVAEQYKHLVTQNYDGMTRAVQSLNKQLVRAIGHIEYDRAIALAWSAFDRRDVKVVRCLPETIAEARAAATAFLRYHLRTLPTQPR